MSSIWLKPLSAEYSTIAHMVSDLTSLAHQPKLRERPTHPKRHVTFALSEKKSAYPAHTRKLDEDEDGRLLFVKTALPFLKTKRISLWCNLHQEKNRWKKSVNLPQNAELLHRYEEEGPPICRDPSTTLEQDVLGNSRERSEEVSILGKKSRL